MKQKKVCMCESYHRDKGEIIDKKNRQRHVYKRKNTKNTHNATLKKTSKTGGDLRYYGRISIFFFTSSTHRVDHAIISLFNSLSSCIVKYCVSWQYNEYICFDLRYTL